MGGGATNLKREPSLAESLPACLKVNRMTILVGSKRHPSDGKNPTAVLRMTILVGSSVDVVLLPVESRVGLDDDALFRPALELFDERRLARL